MYTFIRFSFKQELENYQRIEQASSDLKAVTWIRIEVPD